MTPLSFVDCDGLRPDNLGNYLAGLGLLAAAGQKWPEARGCWRNGHFTVLAPELTRTKLEEFLRDGWKRIPYERWWGEAQKADTKAKSDGQVWAARSGRNDVLARMLDAHIVGAGKNRFNPVLGSGGNIGRRDLAKGATDGEDLLRKAKAPVRSEWLAHTLFGEAATGLPSLGSSGSWFVSTNKAANNGQDWFGAGGISPWSYLLAVEGALLLVGGVGRRMGAHARRYAVFPFVSEAADPQSAGEIGAGRAEFWAPLWEYPASVHEVRALLERGLARTGDRAAGAAHEFALAARGAGADAGVREFVRFVLRQTTSSQVYEALPGATVEVAPAESDDARLIVPLLGWFDGLPKEPRDNKQGGQFHGLRGPVEEAIIEVAAAPDDPEGWRKLWLEIAGVQSRIDRNGQLRGSCRALPWLGSGWFGRAWPYPTAEMVVARAIGSVGAGTAMPVGLNVFGIELLNGAPRFKEPGRPQRAVFGPGLPERVLATVLERRLIDTEPGEPVPLSARCSCPVETVARLLAGALDLEAVVQWLPAFSLVAWEARPQTEQESRTSVDGDLALYFLFRPCFHPRPLWKELEPRPAAARRLLNLIRQEEWGQAVALCADRYGAAGKRVMAEPSDVRTSGERMAAALLVPIEHRLLHAGFQRWIEPEKQKS